MLELKLRTDIIKQVTSLRAPAPESGESLKGFRGPRKGAAGEAAMSSGSQKAMRMLAGLMSRCASFFLCKYCKPRVTLQHSQLKEGKQEIDSTTCMRIFRSSRSENLMSDSIHTSTLEQFLSLNNLKKFNLNTLASRLPPSQNSVCMCK